MVGTSSIFSKEGTLAANTARTRAAIKAGLAERLTEMQHAMEKMKRSDMFIELVKDVVAEELQTEMYVTNDELNTSVQIQNLMTMLQLAPQYSDQIIQQTIDLMGLSPFKQPTQQQGQQPQQGAPQQGPQPQGQPQGAQQPLPNQAAQPQQMARV